MPDPEDSGGYMRACLIISFDTPVRNLIGGYVYAWLIISFDNPVDNLIAAGFGARVTPIDAWSVAV